MECTICSSIANKLFEATILNKYNVAYYKCSNCAAIITESPHWLNEAYTKAITNTDIGLLSRNINAANFVLNFAVKYLNPRGQFLDYGGGYGILVRLLRDGGLDFYRQDNYCENIFANNYDITEMENQEEKFELVTSFEVFEHVYNPIQLVEKLLNYSDTILFSTLLVPQYKIKSANDWWYFATNTGQHITLYTQAALQIIADKFGLNFYTDGNSMHLFTKRHFKNNPLFVRNNLFDKILHKAQTFLTRSEKKKLKSLTEKDHANLKAKLGN